MAYHFLNCSTFAPANFPAADTPLATPLTGFFAKSAAPLTTFFAPSSRPGRFFVALACRPVSCLRKNPMIPPASRGGVAGRPVTFRFGVGSVLGVVLRAPGGSCGPIIGAAFTPLRGAAGVRPTLSGAG